LLEVADRIIVASPNHIDSSQFLLKHREKCEVIPYGIKLGWVGDWRSRHTRAESIRLKYGTPLLLFVGRLVYYKGLTYLIDALQQLPDAQLLIVGSGPLLSDLMKQTVGLRLEKRVKIIPNVSDEDLHAFYEACDVFVLPSSESSEAFGLVQIEAMACGKPVVSTNLKTGVTFVNQHGITGLTVPVRDALSLANALRRLLDDQGLRESLGMNAKERVLKEFTIEKMIDRTIESYRNLLS